MKDLKYYLAEGFEIKSSHVDGGRHCLVLQKGTEVVIAVLVMSLISKEFTKSTLTSECLVISP